MQRRIRKYEILNHGLDHPQYFQGCGVSLTEFEDVATGTGDTAREAYEDAIENLAQQDWDVTSLPVKPRGISKRERVPEDAEENYIYVSIRVR